jgi:hypothetical protein
MLFHDPVVALHRNVLDFTGELGRYHRRHDQKTDRCGAFFKGGNFDLADRLFSSISKAWKSASEDNRGDVRELIPEFFYSPLFLDNINHHDFGKKQNSDEGVDAVELPVWALDDPLLFIHRHREVNISSVESDLIPC